MFNDIKKEGQFETAINKHSFGNQFKDMSSNQRMVLSMLNALIKDMSFRCSDYKDVFYYDVDKDSDVVDAYVIGKFDFSAEGTISLFGQTTDVDKTWKNNQVELICINGEWKIVEFSTDVFDNLPGQDVEGDSGDDLIIY